MSGPTQRGLRLGVRRPVRFYRIDELVSAYSDDLSARGMFVRTDAWLPVNGVVDLCVILPNDKPLVVPARVAYCLPPEQAAPLGRRAGIGFEFLEQAEPALNRLQAYVERIERDLVLARDVRKRVLVACAHPRLQKRLRNALSSAGLSLKVVETRASVLRELASGAWDALVLDESTAQASALRELLRAAVSSRPPLLYLSPSHDELARLHAYRAGVAECLPRPFTDEELRLRLGQLLSSRQRKPTPDLAGALARMPVASVLNLLEHERRSGVLMLQSDAGQLSVCLHEGAISAVDAGELSESARVRVLGALRWDNGYYEFRSTDLVRIASDAWSIAALLLEGAQLEDEGAARRARAVGIRTLPGRSS